MLQEIECPEESLEGFILFGNQVPAYRSFSGVLDPEKVNKKIIAHYTLGKKYAELFQDGREFLETLKSHTENCKKCSKTIKELKTKYKSVPLEKLEKLSEEPEKNLRYFKILD